MSWAYCRTDIIWVFDSFQTVWRAPPILWWLHCLPLPSPVCHGHGRLQVNKIFSSLSVFPSLFVSLSISAFLYLCLSQSLTFSLSLLSLYSTAPCSCNWNQHALASHSLPSSHNSFLISAFFTSANVAACWAALLYFMVFFAQTVLIRTEQSVHPAILGISVSAAVICWRHNI